MQLKVIAHLQQEKQTNIIFILSFYTR